MIKILVLNKNAKSCIEGKMLEIQNSRSDPLQVLQVFEQGKNLPETARYITEYGVTITRTVPVGNIGAIDVKYFYPGGDLNVVPEISTVIPKIF